MALIVAGLSHHTASIETRERCVYGTRDVAPALEGIRSRSNGDIVEAVLLSTCNRTEFYLVDREGANGARPAADIVWAQLDARLDGVEGAARSVGYVRRDRDAVRHLMNVASGLDSMVLGEAQIHGQVRDAWEMSRTSSGPILNRLFQSSLSASGRVRAETTIGHGSASVSSAAVQLAHKIFGSLTGRHAMVLGAGETAELALECLVAEGVRAAVVANRTYEHADAIARRFGAQALRFDDAWTHLDRVDVLICATAAPHAVVARAHIEDAMAARGDRPLCILDVALPRDVDPEVGSLANVFLYDLDDLEAVITANLAARRSQIPAAEAVIDGEAEKYWSWLAGLVAVPVVTRLRAAMEALRADEVTHALRGLGDVTPEQRAAIEALSRSLMNKFLHEPSVRLKLAAANGRGLAVVDAARYLFAVDDDHVDADKRSGGGVKPRALVTGGAGFIGSHIADLFLAEEYEVTVIDNLVTGKRENVPSAAAFVEEDITTLAGVELVRTGAFDVVLHHAAQMDVRKSVADPVYDATINVLGTLRVMEAVRASRRPTRVVFASTGGVLYGDFVTPPNDETFPKDPESPYAVAKLSAELYLAYYARVHGLDTVALRYTNVYGPRQNPHGEAGVVAIFCGRILDGLPLTVYGDGHQTRDYVYVEDVARAALAAARHPLPPAGRMDTRGFNIGTGIETSVLTIAKGLGDVARTPVEIECAPARAGEQLRSAVRVDKAATGLSWRPKVGLDDGLARTFHWFASRKHREGAAA